MDPTFQQAFQKVKDARLIASPNLILLALTNQLGGGWQVVDLVKWTGLSATTVTMAKNKLVGAGLVAEHLPHRDQRTLKIYLTAEGLIVAAQLWHAVSSLAGIEKAYRGTSPPASERGLRDRDS